MKDFFFAFCKKMTNLGQMRWCQKMFCAHEPGHAGSAAPSSVAHSSLEHSRLAHSSSADSSPLCIGRRRAGGASRRIAPFGGDRRATGGRTDGRSGASRRFGVRVAPRQAHSSQTHSSIIHSNFVYSGCGCTMIFSAFRLWFASPPLSTSTISPQNRRPQT